MAESGDDKPSKRGGLALVLGLGGADKAKGDDESPEAASMADTGEEDPGFTAAADECFDALSSGDRAGFRAALKSALEMC